MYAAVIRACSNAGELRPAIPLFAPHLGWPRMGAAARAQGEEMRVLAQGEEGHGLEMLDEKLVHPHLELEEPDLDGALQKVAFVLPVLRL
jgi:hypothetical protein